MEPHAEMRQMAATWFQLYTACLQAGFDAQQSMLLVLRVIANNASGGAQ